MNETDRLTHPTMPISAPVTHWRALGVTLHSRLDSDDLTIGPRPGSTDALLMLALAAGHSDESAICWAITERQRRREAAQSAALADAIRQEASAIASLAAAIRESGTDAALQAILSRVTERTRFAIRQQLGV